MPRWKIDYYKTCSGKIPVKKLIDNLSLKSQAKVYNTLELLGEFGPQLKLPHAKKVINTPLTNITKL